MSDTNTVKTWANQIRAPFLILSVVLTLIGGAVAAYDGVFKFWIFFMCTIGVVLAHIAVNLFNELSDHKTGVDDRTKPTPFSGGSGALRSLRDRLNTLRTRLRSRD